MHRQAVYKPTSVLGNGVEIHPSKIDIRSRTYGQRGFKNTSSEEESLFRQHVSAHNLTDLESFVGKDGEKIINKTE